MFPNWNVSFSFPSLSPGAADRKWGGSCPLQFALYLWSALKWRSCIIFQPSPTKPSRTPKSLNQNLETAREGWLKASQKRWGFTWVFARGRRRTGKKENPEDLLMLTVGGDGGLFCVGVFYLFFVWEWKGRKIKMGRNTTSQVPSGRPLPRLARTVLQSQG